MPNIILTTKCQRNCPYCFAIENSKEEIQKFSFEDFKTALGFLQRDMQYKSVSLLGGEPTLHPQFFEFVEYCYRIGFSVTIFTNGMWSEQILEKILEFEIKNKLIPGRNLLLILNLNEEKYRTPTEDKMQKRLMESDLGRFTGISFNLFEDTCDLDKILDTMIKYNLYKLFRIGLAMPISGKSNTYLLKNKYKTIAKKLADITERRIQHNIPLSFDCGFTLCMFTDEQIGKIFKSPIHEGLSTCFMCNAAFDIYPDLTLSYCYPLSSVRLNLYELKSMRESRFKFEKKFEEAEIQPIFDECFTCLHYGKLCMGGCKAYRSNLDNIIGKI